MKNFVSLISLRLPTWKVLLLTACMVWVSGFANRAWAAGTLTPVGAERLPIKIVDHNVSITINNGFAMTKVVQTFYNPNQKDLEAIYSFPLPKSASLSEVTIRIGEKEIQGEVLPKKKAQKIYEEERDKGNESGLAKKNKFIDFRFHVSPVRAKKRVMISFVYYQPLEIDTGVGRYSYPLEEGGTDEAAKSFWSINSNVDGMLSLDMELKSAYPLTKVRSPGYNPVSEDNNLQGGYYKARYELSQAKLNKDFIFYYRFQDNLPGRIEVVPFRAGKDKQGTFMMVVTPGLDLKPITRGADYIFILDVSGSMSGKIESLTKGVAMALKQMRPNDRFRIITFETSARELTRDWVNATPSNVSRWARKVESLTAGGSTNMYDALQLCVQKFRNLDHDRATSIILVTDAVVNTGVVEPARFHQLMKKYDVRMFGFVMGNSGNWPLMRTICKSSGGFYAGVSNSDDIIGQLLKAKKKVAYECLHNAELRIDGVKVSQMTDKNIGKIYKGQQLVFFGRYKRGGNAKVTLKATLTGKDKTYTTTFNFPDVDTDNPELERLWALNQVEMIEDLRNSGLMKDEEARSKIRKLGVDYQLVTDETSMVVLTDRAFKKHGINRNNRERTRVEHQAQTKRKASTIKKYRVDRKRRAFSYNAPSFSSGGGSVGPFSAAAALIIGGLAFITYRRSKRDTEK